MLDYVEENIDALYRRSVDKAKLAVVRSEQLQDKAETSATGTIDTATYPHTGRLPLSYFAVRRDGDDSANVFRAIWNQLQRANASGAIATHIQHVWNSPTDKLFPAKYDDKTLIATSPGKVRAIVTGALVLHRDVYV